ncbi:protein phosphatase [Haloarculaceae archaeon H-GB2-1]|nr:protein phosphatase [Haloarculaceae archaeon H-GB1-1]MEA5387488.1 protein phosphatase [Haloarculaceae archaeon H-GB11]MEA5408971.1 protein phosphatase [Haloarculaceae archaeon H-GB2-1]
MPSRFERPSADAHRFAPAAPGESTVFGACAPGWHTAASNEDALDDWLGFVQSRGVERVCCLLPGEALERGEGNAGRYVATFGEENVCHEPIPDQSLVSEATLQRILGFLEDSDAADQRVVVHALAGLGRTGQVLAAWLVHGRGYDPSTALETVSEMGRVPLAAADGPEAEADLEADFLARLARFE